MDGGLSVHGKNSTGGRCSVHLCVCAHVCVCAAAVETSLYSSLNKLFVVGTPQVTGR